MPSTAARTGQSGRMASGPSLPPLPEYLQNLNPGALAAPPQPMGEMFRQQMEIMQPLLQEIQSANLGPPIPQTQGPSGLQAGLAGLFGSLGASMSHNNSGNQAILQGLAQQEENAQQSKLAEATRQREDARYRLTARSNAMGQAAQNATTMENAGLERQQQGLSTLVGERGAYDRTNQQTQAQWDLQGMVQQHEDRRAAASATLQRALAEMEHTNRMQELDRANPDWLKDMPESSKAKINAYLKIFSPILSNPASTPDQIEQTTSFLRNLIDGELFLSPGKPWWDATPKTPTKTKTSTSTTKGWSIRE